MGHRGRLSQGHPALSPPAFLLCLSHFLKDLWLDVGCGEKLDSHLFFLCLGPFVTWGYLWPTEGKNHDGFQANRVCQGSSQMLPTDCEDSQCRGYCLFSR